MHLIDHARLHIEKTYTRPIIDRIVRAMIGAVLPHPSRFLLLLRLAKLARSISGLIPKRLRVMLILAPSAFPRHLRWALARSFGLPEGKRQACPTDARVCSTGTSRADQ